MSFSLWAGLGMLAAGTIHGAMVDFSNAPVVALAGLSGPEKKGKFE